jgi:hypothetical protein
MTFDSLSNTHPTTPKANGAENQQVKSECDLAGQREGAHELLDSKPRPVINTQLFSTLKFIFN